MKKVVLLMSMLLLLAGCTAEIKAETKQADEKTLKVAEQCARSFTDGLAYSLSDGLKIVDFSADKPVISDDAIYLFYRGDTLQYLLLQEEEVSVIEIDEELAKALQKECAFVRIGDDLLLASGDECIALGKETVITQKMNDKIRKLHSKVRISLSTVKRKNLEFRIDNRTDDIVDDHGIKYSAGRIVVRFAEGDKAKYIEDYCKFCGGTLVYNMKLANVCVFEFENKTLSELKDLQKRSMELDYVVSASLDGINELH